MFRDWIEDTEETRKKAIAHDFKHWKVDRIFRNNVVDRLQEIIRIHYKALKDIFTMAAIESSYPDFRQIALSKFM